jgi:hypothetical protein
MRFMMSLHGDRRVDAIGEHLANQRVNVLGFEELDDEGVTIAETRGSPMVVERAVSGLRAVWIVDAPSRDALVDLAKSAPGDDGTLEVRESYTPQDFGAPPDPRPPEPAPPPIRETGTHRYIAILHTPHEDRMQPPTRESVAPMDAYCAPLIESNTMIGGEGLRKSERGTRVRRAAAQRFVLDGPFTETKELVGGYMIVQVPTLDDAVDVVRPWLGIFSNATGIEHVEIEVRRLRD